MYYVEDNIWIKRPKNNGRIRGGVKGNADKIRLKLAKRDGPFCHYCECEMVQPIPDEFGRLAPNARTIDHVVPRKFGGIRSLDNLVLACNKCNGDLGHTIEKCSCKVCLRAREVYFYEGI